MAALVAALILAVGLWSAWSWREAQYDVRRTLQQQSRVALLPVSILLENAEARLTTLASRSRFLERGVMRGPADGADDVIIVEPDLSRISGILRAPVLEAIRNSAAGQPGLSMPFQTADGRRALMAMRAPDGYLLVATIDLERLRALWGKLREQGDDAISIVTEDGRIWLHGRDLEGSAEGEGKTSYKINEGALFAAIQAVDGPAGIASITAEDTGRLERIVSWRSDPNHRFYVTYSRSSAAIMSGWLARFPFSLAAAIVLVLGVLLLAARAAKMSREWAITDERLRLSEQRLADWASASADVFWEMDAQHRIKHLRHVGDKMQYGDLDSLIGKTPWELAGIDNPKSDPEWREYMAAHDAHEPYRNFEYEFNLGNGKRLNIRSSGAPTYDLNKKFTGYRGVASEFTGEKLAARAIKESQLAVAESERLLRAIIEELPATVSVKDPEGRLLMYNKRFAQIFDFEDAADGVGKSMGEAFPNDMGKAIAARDKIVLESGKPLELERSAGNYILHIMKYPQLNEAGESIGLVTVGYDITERRESEKRLAESERRLAHMVELLPAGAVYVEDGRITINAAVEKITGRSRQELSTLDDWFRLVPVRPEPSARAIYDEAARTGFSRTFTFPIRMPDGTQRQVEWAGYRTHDHEVWLVRDITETYEADARFRALFERSSTGHLIRQGATIIDCNAAAMAMIGAAAKEDIVELTLADISPEFQPDGRRTEECFDENQSILKLDGTYRFEWRHRRLDGGDLDVEVVATDIIYRDQPAVLVEWHDISERKAYESELLHSRELIERERLLAVERMNDTTRALTGWMWETDAANRFVFMTESVERLVGITAEWHYGKTRKDLIDTGAQSMMPELALVNEAMAAHEPFRDAEFARTSPSGEIQWMRTSGVPFFDEAGAFAGYRGAAFSIDYERQLEAERELLVQEAADTQQRLEQAIDVQTSGFALFDADDGLVAFNEAFSQIVPGQADFAQTGRLFSRIAGNIADAAGLSHAEWDSFVATRMYEHLNDVGPVTRQVSDGRWIKSEERRTSDGGVVGIWTDVSELIDAREEAEAANRAKSEFLAMISHEIRTPMNAVLGMASVLLEGKIQVEQRMQVETIQSSGKALLALINDVLDLSKIEARRFELEREEFSLHGLLDAVMDIAGARGAEKGLDVVAVSGPDVPDRLIGDANRLRQVLLNLVSNAEKFTDSGGVRVNAHLIGKNKVGAVILRIEVHDSGIGIPPDVMKRLFAPFTQADASTTREYGGTGLGLTISKELIELMGGQIGVESETGIGSCFWIEAPFMPADIAGQADQADHTGHTDRASHEDGYGNWLLVGKDGLCFQALEDAVGNADGNVFLAEDAAGALAMLDTGLADAEICGIAILADDSADIRDFTAVLARLGYADGIRVVAIAANGVEVSDLTKLEGVDEAFAMPLRTWRVLSDLPISAVDLVNEGLPTMRESEIKPLDVLLVEDNRVNQMVATAMLKLGDHRVDIAENGLEAISAVLRKRYDIIFMDMQMPQMDGLDATREIRALDTWAAKCPIIAMTANAMIEDRNRCIEAGMDDFISKPIDHNGLNEMIARWTKGRELAADICGAQDEALPAEETSSLNDAALNGLAADLDAILNGAVTDPASQQPPSKNRA